MATKDLPRFRTTVQSYINLALTPPDSEVTMERVDDKHFVSAHLLPMNAEAQAWIDDQKQDHPAKTKAKKARDPAKVDEVKDKPKEDGGEFA